MGRPVPRPVRRPVVRQSDRSTARPRGRCRAPSGRRRLGGADGRAVGGSADRPTATPHARPPHRSTARVISPSPRRARDRSRGPQRDSSDCHHAGRTPGAFIGPAPGDAVRPPSGGPRGRYALRADRRPVDRTSAHRSAHRRHHTSLRPAGTTHATHSRTARVLSGNRADLQPPFPAQSPSSVRWSVRCIVLGRARLHPRRFDRWLELESYRQSSHPFGLHPRADPSSGPRAVPSSGSHVVPRERRRCGARFGGGVARRRGCATPAARRVVPRCWRPGPARAAWHRSRGAAGVFWAPPPGGGRVAAKGRDRARRSGGPTGLAGARLRRRGSPRRGRLGRAIKRPASALVVRFAVRLQSPGTPSSTPKSVVARRWGRAVVDRTPPPRAWECVWGSFHGVTDHNRGDLQLTSTLR